MDDLDRDLIVRMCDIRAVTQCSRGARAFALLHGLDWSDFLANGIDCGTLMDIDDVMAMQVVRYANGRK